MISIIARLCFVFFSVTVKADGLPWDDMQTTGTAKFNFAFWDLYEARLYVSGERFDPNTPYALRLSYLRNIKRDQLIKETKRQLQHIGTYIGTYHEEHINRWTTDLTALWRDVNKGDSITLYVDENKHSHFYVNDTYQGAIEDPEFSQSFSGIWLSENTSEPQLRLSLIGGDN